MKRTIGIICTVVAGLAVVGSVVALVLKKRKNTYRTVVKLPKELEDFAIKHFKFGGSI